VAEDDLQSAGAAGVVDGLAQVVGQEVGDDLPYGRASVVRSRQGILPDSRSAGRALAHLLTARSANTIREAGINRVALQ
jgi:hypothetical protein